MAIGDDVARRRARMPDDTNSILSARTVWSSHRRLAELLRPGISILDVGCGNGAITAGIAQGVEPGGSVTGVDVNTRLIEEANSIHANVVGLSFQVRDAYDLQYNDQFDITSASGVLQWLSDPKAALKEMVKATVAGGKVVVLDYSHEKLKWEPNPPDSVRRFYDKFLEWRASAGMDNLMADNLRSLFEKLVLRDVMVTSQHEVVNRGHEVSVASW